MNATEEKAQQINEVEETTSSVPSLPCTNEARTGSEIDAPLTHQRSGSDLVPGAFDLWAARRFIIAERVTVGADTPLGRRCSNMVELIESYQTADSEFQISNIKRSLVQTVQAIAEIKGRKALPTPVKMLEEA